MSNQNCLIDATRALAEATSLVQAIRQLPHLAEGDTGKIDRLLDLLGRIEVDVSSASTALERQAMQLRELSVVAINSTIRSF